MEDSLSNIFTRTRPRETAGSRSSNRFEYQQNWALCKLLGLYSREDDFLLIFDYHEDVVVLNSEFDPDSAKFFQIKSKASGNWTVNALTKNKEKSESILKKLFSNYEMCPKHTENLVFISNQGLSAELKDGRKALSFDTIEFSQLSIANKEKIHMSVEGKNAVFCDVYGLSKLKISKTELGIKDHVAYAKGKLVEFFESLFPKKNIAIALCYKTLSDEIRRKTNNEKICPDFITLKDFKGISKSEFQGIIQQFVKYSNPDDLWNEVHTSLVSEGYKISEIKKIKSSWTKYSVDRMNADNEPLIKFRKALCNEISTFQEKNSEYDFKTLFDAVCWKLEPDSVPSLKGEEYIVEAAIISEVMMNDRI